MLPCACSNFDDDSLSQWSSYETKVKQEQEKVQMEQRKNGRIARSSSGDPDAKRTFLHMLFIVYSGLTCISAILLCLAQFLGFTIQDLPSDINQGLRYAISMYLILLCLLSVLTELEWFPLVVNSRILTFWVTRGLLYVFMAILTLDQMHDDGSKKSENQILFIKFVSYAFTILGVGYMVMGVFCIQILLKRIRADYQERRYGTMKESFANSDSTESPAYSDNISKELDDLDFDTDKEIL